MTMLAGGRARVAVLIPFYGVRTDGLRKSLQSLAEGTYCHDVILVDDGNKEPVVVPAEWHPRVTVIRQRTNTGITEAMNTGLRHILEAGYEYIGRLDAGDRSVACRIEKQVAFLDRSPDCKLVGGQALFVDERGKALFKFSPPGDPLLIRRMLHRRCSFLHPTVMFRADVFREVGFYREKYKACEDYDLFFRIAERFPTANIPEVLLEYEVSPDAISTRRRRVQLVSKFRIIVAHFDANLLESYLGLVETAIGVMLPRSIVGRLRAMHAQFAGSGRKPKLS
jgi:glycosyltransferase involved in cell wall biosynthesis